MKTFRLFFLVLLVLIITSCTKPMYQLHEVRGQISYHYNTKNNTQYYCKRGQNDYFNK